jgi:hypothetical protein
VNDEIQSSSPEPKEAKPKMVRKVLTVVGVLALVPVVVLGTLLLTSGFSDGSSAVFGGGPLEGGELVTGPEPNWGFVRDIPTIELQLLDPPRSRLIWVLEHEGKAYVVSGYMGSGLGRLWKRWPVQAERDGRAVIRIDGKRYERTLERVMSGPAAVGVAAELARKYRYSVTPEAIAAGETWVFELAPRAAGAAGASR